MPTVDEALAWNQQTDERIRQELQDNHIWLNAFSCINPTDEFLKEVGEQVLRALSETELRDGIGISKTVLLRINKS